MCVCMCMCMCRVRGLYILFRSRASTLFRILITTSTFRRWTIHNRRKFWQLMYVYMRCLEQTILPPTCILPPRSFSPSPHHQQPPSATTSNRHQHTGNGFSFVYSLSTHGFSFVYSLSLSAHTHTLTTTAL